MERSWVDFGRCWDTQRASWSHREPERATGKNREPQRATESHREPQRATESHTKLFKKTALPVPCRVRFMLGVVFLSFNRGFPLKVQLQGCQTRQDAPRRPKRPLGAILTPPKGLLERSWEGFWGPRCAQDAPRWRPDGPRRRQDVPKTAKDGSKTPLRRVQMPPRPLKMQKC